MVIPLAHDLKPGEKKEIDVTTSIAIENGESMIGYQYLHGTNSDVGGYHIKGSVSKNKKGDSIYNLTYTWHDIIDPNLKYSTDREKAQIAEMIPFANPMPYELSITWTDVTVIRANPAFFNWDYGWLK